MTLKKRAFFFFLFLISAGVISASNNQILFKLPVRIDKNINNQSRSYQKEDFKLLVNNEPRAISHLSEIKRSLANSSGIGRNFLLSFHIIEYNQPIENGISYFLNEIIDRKDMLVIASPLKIYRIRISPNKERISRKIKQIISQDCKKFRNLKAQAEQKIIDFIQRIRQYLTRDFTRFINFSTVENYLKYLEKRFNQYKKKFIRPELTKFQSMSEPFGGRDGNKWFIHIQQKKIFAFIPKLKRYLEGLKLHFYTPLFKEGMKFKNETLYSDLFPIGQLKNIIVQNNFCIHTIFQDHSETFPSKLVQNLKKMTESLGGMFLSSSSIQLGFEKIKNHQDQYLELNYQFNGRVETKTINLLLGGEEEGLAYPRSYNKDDITNLMNNSIKKRIGIQNIFIDKNRITFAVNSYKINFKKKFAILKINIEAFNEHNICIFKTQNTLRASEETTIISVPFPRLISKKIRLSIKAFDLLANNFTSVEHEITQNQFPYTVNQ